MRNISLGLLFLMNITFSILFAQRDCLQHAKLDILGRSDRPTRETFTISATGHFYIHYDTTGNAAPDLTDSNNNDVPDFVDEVGIIADSARHVLIDILGYNEEPFDGEGGYDIYIMSYSAGVYGYNYKETGATSYIQIDNDYEGYDSIFNLTPLQIMRISVGHEYFHGIQWGYEENLLNNAYFYEMTSMWFEDVLIPDGNDYLDGWVEPLLNNPTLDFNNIGNGYELGLFGHYLSSFLDYKGIETAKNSTIIREMWERYGSTYSNAFSAVKYVLENNYGKSFIEAWADFISRNLYNGTDESYYYYADQALIDPIDIDLQYFGDTESFTLHLDDESVSIQSYSLYELDTLYITHSRHDYVGRVVAMPVDYSMNNLFWGSNNTSIITDDEVHFIYGSEVQDSIIIRLFDEYPYSYSLIDINPNSGTYESTLSPIYFDNQITLHYFGHQN